MALLATQSQIELYNYLRAKVNLDARKWNMSDYLKFKKKLETFIKYGSITNEQKKELLEFAYSIMPSDNVSIIKIDSYKKIDTIKQYNIIEWIKNNKIIILIILIIIYFIIKGNKK